MPPPRKLSAIIRSLLHKRRLCQDLDEELCFHIDQSTQANIAKGMTADEARRQAVIAFGGLERIAEDCWNQRTVQIFDTTVRDLRHSVRGFLRNPTFALAVIFTVAIGIGAATAVFSVVDRILFRSLPYPHADRLVSLGLSAPIEPDEFMFGTDYLEWRERQTAFESLTSWSGISSCDLTEQDPERLSCAEVESSFLPTFGMQPFLGRNFTRAEDQPNVPKVALLSYGLWKDRFGSDESILDKTITLDGKAVRVIGILPPDFECPTLASADLLVPQAMDEDAQRRPNMGRLLQTFARLRPGGNLVKAKAAMEPLFQESLRWAPPRFQKEIRLTVRSLRDRQIHEARLASWVLLGSVIAVLLIVCANVANLLLARSASRRREWAVRAALGATRARLIRQTLTDSLLLGLLGGAAGCILAYLLLRLFTAIAPSGIPRLGQASLDLRVLLFALALSLSCGVLFGLASALLPPRAEALVGRIAIGSSHSNARQVLIAAQVAVSLVLLAGASLLLRSLWNLENQPLGMHSERVIAANISLGESYSEPARQFVFFEQLEARLERLPGATAVALSDSLPPGGPAHDMVYAAIAVQGRPRYNDGTGGMVAWRSVTPGYFSALDIPILHGRGFREEDRGPATYSLILSDSLARRMFIGESAIGQRLQLGLQGPWFTIVGIAADVKNDGLNELARPEYYVVRRHTPLDAWDHSSLLVRTPYGLQEVSGWVRPEIAALDPTLPVQLETMDQRVNRLAARPRFTAILLTLFAAIGVLLAAVGIYSVMSFFVVERTQEMGLRLALGAQNIDILRLATASGLKPLAAGGLIGLLSALALSRFLTSLLFKVRANDPATLAVATACLAGAGLVAAYIPARRATRVDPMSALRHE